MKKKVKRIIANPDIFTIYQCSGEMSGCYAIYPEEIKKMNEIREAFINETIPESYTIKAFKFGKIAERGSETEIWDIIDKEPIECKIKDILSIDIGYKYCY